MKENVLFPSLYEKDYIIRSLGTIVTQPDVALTELVANAWDAGASDVNIFIPESYNQTLFIEDDGVGRHGLFCFGDEYKVITKKNGKKITYTIKPNVGNEPFAVVDKIEESSDGHGTRLEVVVNKNLPNVDKMIEILSARFLHDPQFRITINRKRIDIEDLTNTNDPELIYIESLNIHLLAFFIDTTKAGKKSIFQGIAFWQSGRLVGEPSWILGQNMVLDGRTTLAKRYTFVIKTDDLAEYSL